MKSGDANERLRETKRRLARQRKQRKILTPSERDGTAVSPHHDVLIVPPAGVVEKDEFFRVPVVKSHQVNQGQTFDGDEKKGVFVNLPELLDSYDYAQRRVLSASRAQDWGDRSCRDRSRGIAFGTLPVKAEPAATSCGACYLVDAENLRFRNAWTAEEWNATSGVDDLPADETASLTSFDVLLAGPQGKVFYLAVKLDEAGVGFWTPGKSHPLGEKSVGGTIECIDLRYEMEIWNQLRNGAVASRVLSRRRAAHLGKNLHETPTVPLVNITTLIADDDLPGGPGSGNSHRGQKGS